MRSMKTPKRSFAIPCSYLIRAVRRFLGFGHNGSTLEGKGAHHELRRKTPQNYPY